MQLNRFKFNPRYYPPMALVRREVSRCASSVVIVTLLDALLEAAAERGSIPAFQSGWLDTSGGAVSVVSAARQLLSPLALIAWGDAHFYWTHRLLHEVPWLFRHVHKAHHESFCPDPFSGLSFHPIEGAIYFSSMLVWAAFPVRLRWMYTLYKLGLILSPINGHLGHGPASSDPVARPSESWVPLLGWVVGDARHHEIHHARFLYNYSALPFWDWAMGTAYPEGGAGAAAGASKAAAAAGAGAGGSVEGDARHAASEAQAAETRGAVGDTDGQASDSHADHGRAHKSANGSGRVRRR